MTPKEKSELIEYVIQEINNYSKKTGKEGRALRKYVYIIGKRHKLDYKFLNKIGEYWPETKQLELWKH